MNNSQLRSKAFNQISDYGFFKFLGMNLLFGIIVYIPMLGTATVSNAYIKNQALTDEISFNILLFVFTVVAWFLTGVLSIGYLSYYINVARGIKAGISDIFYGFKNFWTNALIFLGCFIVMLPAIIIAVIGAFIAEKYNDLALFIVIASFVWMFYIMLKYGFVAFIAADKTNHKYNLIILFKVAKKISYGYKARLFWMSAFIYVIAFAVQLFFSVLIPFIMKNNDSTTVSLIVNVLMIIIQLFVCMWGYMSITNLYIQANDEYFRIKPVVPEIDLQPETPIDEQM